MWIKFEHVKPWYEGQCLVRGKNDCTVFLADYCKDDSEAWTVYRTEMQIDECEFLGRDNVYEWLPIPY